MKKNSFVEGTFIATLTIVIVKLLGMVYVIPFYAIIGGAGRALYAYAYNIYVIVLDISSAGIPIAISKLVSEFNTAKMLDAKARTLKLGRRLVAIVSVVVFLLLFIFAPSIAKTLAVSGGNSAENIAFVIRCVSFALLVVPMLSVSKGYLQGHNFIAPSSFSQLIEQVVRIVFVLTGSYLALKVFNLSIQTGIGIAVFGAFVGGFAALLYIIKKINDNKKSLNLEGSIPKDDISNKSIIKKIISYAVPFIIIDTAISIYQYIDMFLILKTMEALKYEAATVEFVATSISTWAPKISMIVSAIAMGMCVSLIPSIVEAFTKKDYVDVNNKVNKSLQMLLVISVPLTIGISMLSTPMWSTFFGHNALGAKILAINIFTALFLNIFMITTSTLQSLNKFKAVYFSAIAGFATNAILDVPLMLLCNKIGIDPFYGAAIATIIGCSLAIFIALRKLRNDHGLSYKKTLRTLIQISIPSVAMIVVVVLLKLVVPINVASRLSSILYMGIIGLMGAVTYLFIAYKMKILNRVFGKEYVAKIIKKLTFGKVRID